MLKKITPSDSRLNGAARAEFHRAYKQLASSEKCQCRTARSQRNHLACYYHAWLSLKIKTKELNQSLYQIRNSLFTHFLKLQLRKPQIAAL